MQNCFLFRGSLSCLVCLPSLGPSPKDLSSQKTLIPIGTLSSPPFPFPPLFPHSAAAPHTAAVADRVGLLCSAAPLHLAGGPQTFAEGRTGKNAPTDLSSVPPAEQISRNQAGGQSGATLLNFGFAGGNWSLADSYLVRFGALCMGTFVRPVGKKAASGRKYCAQYCNFLYPVECKWRA